MYIKFGWGKEKNDKKEDEYYDITNNDGVTMHVNSMNKHLVESFKSGLNPRCGLPLSQCSDGIGHGHG